MEQDNPLPLQDSSPALVTFGCQCDCVERSAAWYQYATAPSGRRSAGAAHCRGSSARRTRAPSPVKFRHPVTKPDGPINTTSRTRPQLHKAGGLAIPGGFPRTPARGSPPHPRQPRPPQWPVIRRMSTPPTETSYDHRSDPTTARVASHPPPTRAVARVGRPDHPPARRAADDDTKGSKNCLWLCWPGYSPMSGCPLITCSVRLAAGDAARARFAGLRQVAGTDRDLVRPIYLTHVDLLLGGAWWWRSWGQVII